MPSIPLSASQITCQKRVLSEQLVTAKFLSFGSSHHFVEELKDVILEGNAFGLQELFVVIRKTQSIVIIHCQGVPAKLQACFCLGVCGLRVYVCVCACTCVQEKPDNLHAILIVSSVAFKRAHGGWSVITANSASSRQKHELEAIEVDADFS